MNRKAQAVWHGPGKTGKGTLTSQSTVLSNANYGFGSRFEDGPGTNPEELLAAAHAGCFTMALAFALERAGHPAEELKTDAVVTLDKDGDGFKISRSALTLTAKVPGLDDATFGPIADGAKQGCPVSKLFNAEITLNWSLTQ